MNRAAQPTTGRRRLALESNICSIAIPKASPFTDEIRDAIKARGRAPDVAYLIVWMLTHYTDEGAIRSPQARRRLSIVLDGIRYVLVKSEAKS